MLSHKAQLGSDYLLKHDFDDFYLLLFLLVDVAYFVGAPCTCLACTLGSSVCFCLVIAVRGM